MVMCIGWAGSTVKRSKQSAFLSELSKATRLYIISPVCVSISPDPRSRHV